MQQPEAQGLLASTRLAEATGSAGADATIIPTTAPSHCGHACCAKFGLDLADLNDRHKMSFDTYEEGKLDLDTYLDQVVFYRERPFSSQEFKEFMFSRSKDHPEMIELVRTLKQKYRLWSAAISNEGREMTVFRIKKFNLKSTI